MSHELTDTRITAYIFGELSPEETAAFERELANSTQLREELAAIRETLTALELEFEARSAGVGDSQRQVIEEAIHTTSSTRKVNLNHSTNETSRRRLLVIAVMAASLMIVVGLAYPYLQNQTGTPVSMNDPGSSPTIVAENTDKTGTETDEQSTELVEMFAIDDDAEDFVEGTIVQLPNFRYTQPGSVWVDVSPNQSQTILLNSEGLDGALQAARESNASDGSSGAAGLSKGNRRFDTEYDFGLRPSPAAVGDALTGEDADEFGEVADFDLETMMEGKISLPGLPADKDGDGVTDAYVTDSKKKENLDDHVVKRP